MIENKKDEVIQDQEITGEKPEPVDEEAEQEAQEQERKSVEEQLEDALAESSDLRDKMLRVAAEFENFKKRMERERATMLKYSGEHILRALLPVVDNLERAVEQGKVLNGDAGKKLEALLEGVELTLKSLLDTLEKIEVKPVESIGQPFDPNVQEAMAMEQSDSVPANHVLGEFEKGYFYKDRLLRAARVIVSSGSPEEG